STRLPPMSMAEASCKGRSGARRAGMEATYPWWCQSGGVKKSDEHFMEAPYLVTDTNRKGYGVACSCGFRSPLFDTREEAQADDTQAHPRRRDPGGGCPRPVRRLADVAAACA